MRVGDMNKRITFQYQTRTSDLMGGSVTTWVDADTVWAAVWPVSAKEVVEGGQTAQTITHRIRVRYVKAVLPSWRIRFGERYFAIVSIINPNEQGRWMDILCLEAAS